MSPPYWDPTNQVAINTLLEALCARVTSAGWLWSPEVEVDLFAIASLIDLPNDIRGKRGHISFAIRAIALQNSISTDAFRQALADRLEIVRSDYRKQAGPVWFLMPLRLPFRLDSPPYRLRALGHTFGILRIDDVKDYLGDYAGATDPSNQRFFAECRKIPTYLCANANIFPLESAFDELSPAFDAIRGMMELCLGLGSWKMASTTVIRRGRIPHPRHVLCVRPEHPTVTLTFDIADPDDDPSSTESDSTPPFLERVSKALYVVSDSIDEGSTRSLIVDALRLYAQAMDETHTHNCFLSLWQMAEVITLDKDDGGKGDRVIARLGQIARARGNHHSLGIALRSIMQKRNEAVHRGAYGAIDHDDVNILKMACEFALLWLIENCSQISTRAHLRRWWQLDASGDNELTAVQTVVDFVRKTRLA